MKESEDGSRVELAGEAKRIEKERVWTNYP